MAAVLCVLGGCTEQPGPEPKPLPGSVHEYRLMHAGQDVRQVCYPARFVKPDPERVYPTIKAGPDPGVHYAVLCCPAE